ncbi:MAG: ATP-binding protein [Eubacteriales bacterium]|nr:ATP-binding protein [Eubacteriales bacterium]
MVFEREIKRISAQRAQVASMEREAKREKLAQSGDFLKVEAELNAAGARLARASIAGREAAAAARREFDALRERYTEVLAKAGFSAADLELKAQCKLCGDSGYLADNRLCSCLRRELPSLLPAELNFFPDPQQNFAKYNSDIFTPEKRPEWYGGEISPRVAAEDFLAFAKDYVKDFTEGAMNLFFYGDPGTGKTYLLAAIANALLQEGYIVSYLTADRFFQIMSKKRFLEQNFNPNPVEQDLNRRQLELLQSAALLIIDDLGIENPNAANYSELFQLFERRARGQKPLLIGSNISPDEFRENYDERLSSRLVGSFDLIQLMGPDLRVLAAQRRLAEG